MNLALCSASALCLGLQERRRDFDVLARNLQDASLANDGPQPISAVHSDLAIIRAGVALLVFLPVHDAVQFEDRHEIGEDQFALVILGQLIQLCIQPVAVVVRVALVLVEDFVGVLHDRVRTLVVGVVGVSILGVVIDEIVFGVLAFGPLLGQSAKSAGVVAFGAEFAVIRDHVEAEQQGFVGHDADFGPCVVDGFENGVMNAFGVQGGGGECGGGHWNGLSLWG